MIVIFVQFVILGRGGHCEYSPQVLNNLATPLSAPTLSLLWLQFLFISVM
jgi:hypothetical protein